MMKRAPRIAPLHLMTALAAAALPMQLQAAGFQVNEHSAAGLGRAFAGEAAITDDASIIARNAAGIAFLDRATFTTAVSYIKPDVNVERTTGHKDNGVAESAVIPTFYYAQPINERWSIGIGAFSNFGLATNYSESAGITTAADKTDLKTYNLNPTVSYKINDQLSVGFGVNATYADAILTSSHPQLGNKEIFKLEGDDWGYGWNAGILWQATEATRLGLSYRSEVDLTLKGDVSSEINPLWNTGGSVDLILPEITELSIYHQLNSQFAVHASAMKIGWSSFEKLETKLDNGNPFPTIQENWHDSWRYAVGMTYQHNQHWTFRSGIAKDNSPVDNQHRTYRIPDSDRLWLTFGGSYRIDNDQSVDFGYAYLKGEKVDIHENSINSEVTKGNAQIFSVQYNYRF